MAVLIDEVRNLSWAYASAHSESKIPRPEPVKRPGLATRRSKRRAISMAVARRLDPRLRGLSDEEAQAFLDKVVGRG